MEILACKKCGLAVALKSSNKNRAVRWTCPKCGTELIYSHVSKESYLIHPRQCAGGIRFW